MKATLRAFQSKDDYWRIRAFLRALLPLNLGGAGFNGQVEQRHIAVRVVVDEWQVQRASRATTGADSTVDIPAEHAVAG